LKNDAAAALCRHPSPKSLEMGGVNPPLPRAGMVFQQPALELLAMGWIMLDPLNSRPRVEEEQCRRDDQDEGAPDHCVPHAGYKCFGNYDETPNHFATAQCHDKLLIRQEL
jgi:hypothetical protein